MAPALERSFPTRKAATAWVKREQKNRQMKLDPNSGGTGFIFICGKLVQNGKRIAGEKCKCMYRFSKKKNTEEVVLEESVSGHGDCTYQGTPSILELAFRPETRRNTSSCEFDLPAARAHVCVCVYV
jgi:hypothetical protein